MEKIVIRSSNWLGDAVMSVPAVRALKRGNPGAHVTVLTPEKLADVWRLVAEVDEVIAFPAARGGVSGVMNVFRVATLIRGRGPPEPFTHITSVCSLVSGFLAIALQDVLPPP